VGLSNYKIDYTNSSLGANYRLNNDLSVFARTSKGYRAIADRFLYNPSGLLNDATGQLGATGKQVAAAPVKQNEIGTRVRGKMGSNSYGASVTYFRSTTDEFDYDQTRQDNPSLPNFQGPKLNILGYKASGVEVEAGFSMGAFSLNGNLTQSKSTKTADFVTSNIGKESSGVPTLRYNLIPRYTIGPVTIGGVLRGQNAVWADDANTVRIAGHQIINAFVNYEFAAGWMATMNINNLTDKVYPVGSGGFVNGSASIFGAGMNLGRTVNAGVKYTF
jgi:outer membrane receptor protein involved in Fe transport